MLLKLAVMRRCAGFIKKEGLESLGRSASVWRALVGESGSPGSRAVGSAC